MFIDIIEICFIEEISKVFLVGNRESDNSAESDKPINVMSIICD